MANNESYSFICGSPVSDSLLVMIPAVPVKETPSVQVGPPMSLKVASYFNEIMPLEMLDQISDYEDEDEFFDDEI